MARPQLSPQERRESPVHLRLTQEERAAFEARARAHGLSLSDYLRRAALDRPMPAPVAEGRDLAALTAALLRLGVNLNQIARRMNAGAGPPPHLAALTGEIAQLVERLAHDAGGDREGPEL
jgi:uncharacterized protein (DUF1778 family)